MLPEPHRSRYLRALGVDVYMPRRPLPGAAPSVPISWVQEEAAEPAVISDSGRVPSALTADADAPGQRAIDERSNDDSMARSGRPALPDVGVTDRRSAPEPDGAAVPVQKPEVPRFSLMVARCDTGIVVIDEGPGPGRRRDDYLRLLGNLLFALYRRPVVVESDTFVWPMVKNPVVDQGEQAARETLGAYLQRQCSLAGGQTLVALGSGPARWLDEDPVFHLVAGISLWRCLTDAGVKRTLWQQLQPLRTSAS